MRGWGSLTLSSGQGGQDVFRDSSLFDRPPKPSRKKSPEFWVGDGSEKKESDFFGVDRVDRVELPVKPMEMLVELPCM